MKKTMRKRKKKPKFRCRNDKRKVFRLLVVREDLAGSEECCPVCWQPVKEKSFPRYHTPFTG
jgi:DNA repair exonuclease SbcCD ATPase subunit